MTKFQVPSMEWSLRNMRRLGFDPPGIVDIGAYEGEWTSMARSVFPEASFLMIEAQEAKRPKLEAVKGLGAGKVDFRIAVLGPEPREAAILHLYDSADTAASVLKDHIGGHSRTATCAMVTLDQILSQESFARPALLKLDVQGYELEVIKGAKQTLSSAEAVLMEVSLIELYEHNPLLLDATVFMAGNHFRAYDICGLVRRPLDEALCQADIIFVKNDSPLVKQTHWI